MKFVNQRPYADPAVAARNLLEIANACQKNLCLQYVCKSVAAKCRLAAVRLSIFAHGAV